MSKHGKLLERILHGASDANISFDGLCALLQHLGFEQWIRGSHHIFTMAGGAEILNLQPRGNNAKPYQVKQVRLVVLQYKLGRQNDA